MSHEEGGEDIEFAALTEALFRPGVGDDPADPVTAPADLEGVGPATATVIEAAPFEAADVAAGRTSYRDLVEAGVEPVVAERLRRAYSLVWSFEWRVGGDDLTARAEQIRGFSPQEREWVARSVPAAPDATPPAASDGGAVGGDPPPSSPSADPTDDGCERCGGPLATYTLGDSRTVQCEACGYVDLSVSARRG